MSTPEPRPLLDPADRLPVTEKAERLGELMAQIEERIDRDRAAKRAS